MIYILLLISVCFIGSSRTLYFTTNGYVCPEENNSKLNITWNITRDGACVVSSPPCINEHKKLLKRCCTHAGWDPAPGCTEIQQEPPFCPHNFTYHPEQKLCYILTNETQFPPNCPHKNVIDFSESKKILENIKEPVWMPVKRDLSDGIGFFRWIEYSSLYKQVFEGDIYFPPHRLQSDMNCLVYMSNEVQGVSCNDTYRGICAYDILDYSRSYCKARMEDCMQYYYNNNNICICVNNVASEDNGQKLAEITFPYQNQIIKVLSNDSCLIGLEKVEYENYRWINTKLPLSYTYWSPYADLEKIENKFGVFTPDGWDLVADKQQIPCFLHENYIVAEKPCLSLSFNKEDLVFELAITNEDELREFTEVNHTKVFCFTDASGRPEIIDRYQYLDRNGENLTFPAAHQGPGHYWCEAVDYSNLKIVTSQKILYSDRDLANGCEFIAIVSLYPAERSEVKIVDFVQKVFDFLLGQTFSIRVFKIIGLDEINRFIFFNIHFTLRTQQENFSCLAEFQNVNKSVYAATEAVSTGSLQIWEFYSSNYCMNESLGNLTWPITPINSSALPEQLCLTSKGYLLTRRCSGNFTDGARWEDLAENCSIPINTTNVTDDLHNILIRSNTAEQKIDDLYNITKLVKNYSSLDIYLMSEVLERIEEVPENHLDNLIYTTSSINEVNRDTLAKAQMTSHATDRILLSLDKMVTKINLPPNEPIINRRSSNTLFLACDIASISFGGVALLKERGEYHLRVVPNRDDFEQYMSDPSFEAGVMISHILQDQIVSSRHGTSAKVIIVVYLLDALFNPTRSGSESAEHVSQIFDVLIPGFQEEFIAPLVIFYRIYSGMENTCLYWDFQKSSSFWKNDSVANSKEDFIWCEFWHLTHFALLLADEPHIEDMNFHKTLDIITDINCILSLLGLTAILLTAVLFERWRKNTGNKILINFVFAIAFQICLLYISESIHKNGTANSSLCTIVGVLLHYSVISGFCWMLVIAKLQFQRFVEVFGGPPEHVMLKACIIGWILPLAPVICVLFSNSKGYVKNRVGLCYPSGLSLYLSIWLPIGIIVAINIVIFTCILYSVSVRSVECLVDNNEYYYQWRLAFLLFFMLGLTWAFGLLIDFGILFLYLFTLLAPLQGFIIFLFFIVFNRSTRMLYIHYFKEMFSIKKLK